MSRSTRAKQKNRRRQICLTDLPECRTRIEHDATVLAQILEFSQDFKADSEPIFADFGTQSLTEDGKKNTSSLIVCTESQVENVFESFIESFVKTEEVKSNIRSKLKNSRFVLVRVV